MFKSDFIIVVTAVCVLVSQYYRLYQYKLIVCFIIRRKFCHFHCHIFTACMCVCVCLLCYALVFCGSYYFRGDTASYKNYLNPGYFQNLAHTIDLVQSTIAGSKYPKLAMWIGETSDAWHSGTANVSDRFVSGFL